MYSSSIVRTGMSTTLYVWRHWQLWDSLRANYIIDVLLLTYSSSWQNDNLERSVSVKQWNQMFNIKCATVKILRRAIGGWVIICYIPRDRRWITRYIISMRSIGESQRRKLNCFSTSQKTDKLSKYIGLISRSSLSDVITWQQWLSWFKSTFVVAV